MHRKCNFTLKMGTHLAWQIISGTLSYGNVNVSKEDVFKNKGEILQQYLESKTNLSKPYM